MKLSSPFKNVSAAELYDRNESGPNGFFPRGINRFWHGGIHLKSDQPILAVCDGQVIAYRIDNTYQKLEDENARIASSTGKDNQGEREFSTGFVLMRHLYQNTERTLTIEFFSLYMHLACWDLIKDKREKPLFLNDKRYYARAGAHIWNGYVTPAGETRFNKHSRLAEEREILLQPDQGAGDKIAFRQISSPIVRYLDPADLLEKSNALQTDTVVVPDDPPFLNAGDRVGWCGVNQVFHHEVFTTQLDFFDNDLYKCDEALMQASNSTNAEAFNLYNWRNYFVDIGYDTPFVTLKDFMDTALQAQNREGVSLPLKQVRTAAYLEHQIKAVVKDPKIGPFLRQVVLNQPTTWDDLVLNDDEKRHIGTMCSWSDERIENDFLPYAKTFSWWQEVKAEVDRNEPDGSFPDGSGLFFFHPIAFIEHLRKLEWWFPAAILYPSLLCPAVVDLCDQANLHLFILTDQAFKTKFENTEPGAFKRIVNSLLRLEHWWELAGDNGLKVINEVGALFNAWGDEFADSIDAITCSFKGEINASLEWQNTDGSIGLISDETRGKEFNASLSQHGTEAFYRQGLKYGFLISLPLASISPAQVTEDNRLWHISWKPKRNEENNLWQDTQDQLLRHFLTNKGQGRGEKDFLYHAETLKTEKGIQAIEICQDATIAAYHPVFLTTKNYLGFGHLSDMHLDVRQNILEESTAQLMPGSGQEGSTPIGSMIANTIRVFARALTECGKQEEIDLVFLTGDLVNQTSNVDPLLFAEKKTPSNPDIWDGVNVGGDFKDNPFHQWNIDSRIAMTLILDYYLTYQKPLVFVIGNHEEFPIPYGISPRIGGIKRADEMICADHNLTYAEAILMFGPTYSRVVYHEGNGLFNSNMDEERRFFFHLYFNPFADFIIQSGKQLFLCLDWESGQDIIDPPPLGGHLTRSKGAVSDLQLELIRKCERIRHWHSNTAMILLAHFAFLGYDEHVPLFQTEGDTELKPPIEKISLPKPALSKPLVAGSLINEYLNNPSHDYAHGSFETNIKNTYRRLFGRDTAPFDYILSGHTHRPAAYFITSPADSSGKIRYKAFTVDKKPVNLYYDQKPCVMIAGSAGPIGKQNLNGEFRKWGHICPSGNFILYHNTGTSQYGWLEITRDSAGASVKPRFAVAMDYYNIMENPVFIKFESLLDSPYIFNIRMNSGIFPKNLNIVPTIEKLSLFYYDAGTDQFNSIAPQRLSSNEPFAFNCIFNQQEFEIAKAYLTKKNPIDPTKGHLTFLSIVFSPIEKPGFDQYDYDSPWVFRVDFRDLTKKSDIPTPYSYYLKQPKDPRAFDIVNHKDVEVPDFGLYSEVFPDDYPD